MEAGIGAVANGAVADAESEQDHSKDITTTYKSQLSSKNLEITALGVHEQRITNLVVCLDILRHLRHDAEQNEKRQTGTAYAKAPMCQLSCAEVNGVLLDSPSSVVRLLLQRLDEACRVTLAPSTVQVLRHVVRQATDGGKSIGDRDTEIELQKSENETNARGKANESQTDGVGCIPISIEVGCSLPQNIRRLFCAQTPYDGRTNDVDNVCLSSALELARANVEVDAATATVVEGQTDAAQQSSKRETEALKPADVLKNVSMEGGGMTFFQ